MFCLYFATLHYTCIFSKPVLFKLEVKVAGAELAKDTYVEFSCRRKLCHVRKYFVSNVLVRSEEIADEETSTSKFTAHRPAHPALQPDVLLCDYRALIIKIDMEKVQQLSPEP